VRDAVLEVVLAVARKAERRVETLQVLLRADADGDRPVPLLGGRDGPPHQLAPEPAAPHRRRRDHAADDRGRLADTRREQPRAGDDRLAVDGKQVRRRRIEPVRVEVRTALLDHEHLLPQPQQRVQLGRGQRGKLADLPAHGASYYARVSPFYRHPSLTAS
jgi:hypothetical protein